MRRIIMSLMLALFVAALTGGTALAEQSVDPSTLTPPPPAGAVCQQTGQYVICQTYGGDDLVNDPAFMISCGTGDRTVYASETVHREGARWYNSDGLLVKRFGVEHAEGTLSLSPTGEEPTVRTFHHISWVDYFSTPGDFDSAITYRHGNDFTILLPGGGDLLHLAGLETVLPSEDTHHGVARLLNVDEETGFVSDPEVNAALCEALGDPIAE